MLSVLQNVLYLYKCVLLLVYVIIVNVNLLCNNSKDSHSFRLIHPDEPVGQSKPLHSLYVCLL